MNYAIMTGKGMNRQAVDAILGIHHFNPEMKTVWVEAGEIGPAPADIVAEHMRLLFLPGGSFTQCVNRALNMYQEDADWFFVLDDDIVCSGKLDFTAAGRTSIYGPTLITDRPEFPGVRWLEGWALAIPGEFIRGGLRFDENIIASGFEDLDICMQVASQGFEYKWAPSMFPLKHLALGAKERITPDYNAARSQNIQYVKEKWDL